ncbi:MAG: PTS sugar transporter subunit IIB [Actinomycetes bacterium]|jgi:PTS system galactitol-specific IIB component|nr:PTS galactitol transporter subunit IIB [Acidimicrobiia bacterium]
MKKVLIACGTGIATSTVVADKVKKHLQANGIEAKVDQTKVAELHRGAKGYDLIVATTNVPKTVECPVVNGLPFLTGVGVDKVLDEIVQHLKD